MVHQLSRPCIQTVTIPLSSQNLRVQSAYEGGCHIILIRDLIGHEASHLNSVRLAQLGKFIGIGESGYYITTGHTGCQLTYPCVKSCLVRIAAKDCFIHGCNELFIAHLTALVFLAEYEVGNGLGTAFLAFIQNLYPCVQSCFVRVSAKDVLVETIYEALHTGGQILISGFCCGQHIILAYQLLL